MKSVRDKFKRNVIFVKPLYRKVKSSNKIENKKDRFVINGIDSASKLGGRGDKHTADINYGDKKLIFLKRTNKNTNQHKSRLRDAFLYHSKSRNLKAKSVRRLCCKQNCNVNGKFVQTDMLDISDNLIIPVEDDNGKGSVGDRNKPVIIHKVPDTWLRVYPDSMKPGESICSVVFRCLACQLGMFSFLTLWTLVWCLMIQIYEGPNEDLVSANFIKEQNQLIIDLATELRLVTPVSSKWRRVIEARIEEERELTIAAVGEGAKSNPGRFWDISGTFLFTIYVMTALGFGAPVPHTIYGRTAALIYAALAVPGHIYLMVNASTCVVVHVESSMHRVSGLLDKVPFMGTASKNFLDGRRASPDCSRNSDSLKTRTSCRKKLLVVFRLMFWGRSVPLTIALYYACGAIVFGVCRSKTALGTFMFPVEFTTTGGLEHVSGSTRLLYAIYVEGAMCLLAFMVATVRRYSGAAVNSATERYRLFESEHCHKCDTP